MKDGSSIWDTTMTLDQVLFQREMELMLLIYIVTKLFTCVVKIIRFNTIAYVVIKLHICINIIS